MLLFLHFGQRAFKNSLQFAVIILIKSFISDNLSLTPLSLSFIFRWFKSKKVCNCLISVWGHIKTCFSFRRVSQRIKDHPMFCKCGLPI